MKNKLKVHIVGIHGVPARYGGFETLADFLCLYLKDKYEITVYCSSKLYPERLLDYHGAKLKYIKLEASGFKGIWYDLITYIYALFFADIILYLSPVGSGFMTPLKLMTRTKVIVNHGGLNEWEREKLNWLQKKWAKFNHRIASSFADQNITDNLIYKNSIKNLFKADSIVIKYGGNHTTRISIEDEQLKRKYPFVCSKYAISVSRAQIDNNIHIVLDSFDKFKKYKIVLVSNWNISDYGKQLKRRYNNHPNMILLDAIYDKYELDYLRSNAYIYIHSHSRCGTAPSLVEAMNLGSAIISYDVPTNRETTKNKAIYFQDTNSLVEQLKRISKAEIEKVKKDMENIASKEYTWEKISDQYNQVFRSFA